MDTRDNEDAEQCCLTTRLTRYQYADNLALLGGWFSHRFTMNFYFDGEQWSASAVAALTADIEGASEAMLPALMARLQDHPRQMAIARGLYGIHPLVPEAGVDPDVLRVRSKAQIAAEFGISKGQLQSEVDFIRGMARSALAQLAAQDQPTGEESENVSPAAITQQPTFSLQNDDDVISEHGFDAYQLSPSDRKWLVSRLTDPQWAKALTIKLTADLAQQSIINALEIRRLRAAQARLSPASKDDAAEYRATAKAAAEAESAYRAQLEQLEQLAPYLNLSGKGVALHGGFSLITEALQQWYKDGSKALIDGVFTATNIQVLLRTSAQVPEPQYRAGHVVYLAAARDGLLDPHWKNTFSVETLRAIDHGFKGAFARATPKSDQPDLKATGPDGEYKDFVAEGKSPRCA